jgi:hypothetical protein
MSTRASIFVALISSCIPFITFAGELTDNRSLSTLQVVYVESLPKEDSIHPIFNLLKKFEPSSESQRMAETVLTTDESINRARKTVIEGGFVDLPVPLLTHLTQGFNERGIDTTPVFRSSIRSKEEKEEVLSKLSSRLGTIQEGGRGKSKHSLMLMPYRIALAEGGNAALKIGAMLYDEANKEWVWIYYVTINFGGPKSKLTDESAHKLAMTVINAMEKGEGWVSKK